MLSSLLLIIKQFYCVSFSFSLLFLKKDFATLLLSEKTKQNLALVIPTCAQATVAKEVIEIPPLASDKTSKILPT